MPPTVVFPDGNRKKSYPLTVQAQPGFYQWGGMVGGKLTEGSEIKPGNAQYIEALVTYDDSGTAKVTKVSFGYVGPLPEEHPDTDINTVIVAEITAAALEAAGVALGVVVANIYGQEDLT